MRLIDADAIKKAIKDYGKGAINDGMKTLDPVDDIVALAGLPDFVPEIDAVPVEYGKWLDGECDDGCEMWYCSRCHYPVKTIAGHPTFDYCPHCGVNMTEKGAAK